MIFNFHQISTTKLAEEIIKPQVIKRKSSLDEEEIKDIKEIISLKTWFKKN